MKEEKTVFKKNRNVVARKIDRELFLIPLIKTKDEVNAIYSLNKTAADIWDLIGAKKSIGEIRNSILDRYDVTPSQLEKDIESFIKDAVKINAIKKAGRG